MSRRLPPSHTTSGQLLHDASKAISTIIELGYSVHPLDQREVQGSYEEPPFVVKVGRLYALSATRIPEPVILVTSGVP